MTRNARRYFFVGETNLPMALSWPVQAARDAPLACFGGTRHNVSRETLLFMP